MKPITRILGASVLGLAVAGCGTTKLDDIDPKLKKYHIDNSNNILDVKEARLFWELEFDKDHDGKLSGEETLKAFDYLSTLPDAWTRDNMFKALADFRKESLEKKAGKE